MSKDSHIQPTDTKGAISSTANLDISELCEKWNALEARLSRLLSDDTRNQDVDNTAIAGEKLREVYLSEIQTEQTHLLNKLLTTPATSASDIFVKLAVWKSIVAPEDDNLDYLSPADQLVLSAYKDMTRSP